MNPSIILKELKYKTSRSSGAGGQHVNKVSSKVEVSFDVQNSNGLTQDEKTRILQKLSSRINKSRDLLMSCSDTRSQHRNKELLIRRFMDTLKSSLHVSKKRKPSKPSHTSIRKRLENKKKQSLKKKDRKNPDF